LGYTLTLMLQKSSQSRLFFFVFFVVDFLCYEGCIFVLDFSYPKVIMCEEDGYSEYFEGK